MRAEKIERIVGWSLLTVTCAFALVYWLAGFPGFWGSDDLWYAENAASIVHGKFSLARDLYVFRWSVLFPLAASFAVFGINDVAGALPFLIATSLTAYLVWLSCEGLRFLYKALAVCMFMLHTWTLYNAVMMMPDSIVALGFMMSWFALHRTRLGEDKVLKWIALFSGGMWLSVLAKESIILYLPYFSSTKKICFHVLRLQHSYVP